SAWRTSSSVPSLHARRRAKFSVVNFSRAGLASGGDDAGIVLWDVSSHTNFGPPLLAHTDGVLALAAAPGGKTMYSGGADHRAFAWDLDPVSWRRLACRIANRETTDAACE